MPRLILVDDDGRTLFDREVSRESVQGFARFLRRNMPAIKAVASFRRAVSDIAESWNELLRPRPPARRVRSR